MYFVLYQVAIPPRKAGISRLLRGKFLMLTNWRMHVAIPPRKAGISRHQHFNLIEKLIPPMLQVAIPPRKAGISSSKK